MKIVSRTTLVLIAILSQLLLVAAANGAAYANTEDSPAFLTKGPPIPPESIYTPWASTRISKAPAFDVSWCGNTAATVAYYTVRYRMGGDSPWSDWKTRTTDLFDTFTGSPGRTYYFRSRATNTDGSVQWSKVKRTIVPYDDRQLIHKKFGWHGSETDSSSWFYRGTVTYSKTKGQTIVYKFRGKTVSLISTKGRDRSKAKIYIDNVHRNTIDAYATERKWRYTVFTANFRESGVHYLKVVNLATAGRSRFDIDALAVGR